MGKIKIHEIAKEVGLTSKEIIKIANELGINVSSHLSAVDDEQASKIRNNLNNKESKKVEETPNVKKAKKETTTSQTSKKSETPVIIRREVIISDEDEKKNQNNKNHEQNKKDVGFVERKNKNDYNIVYRNKQTKPLTVSELFGLKPKEEPKKETEEIKKVEEVKQTKPVEEKVKEDVPKRENISEPKKEKVEEPKNYQNRNFDNHNNRYNNDREGNRNQNFRNNNNNMRNNRNQNNRNNNQNNRNNQNTNNYKNNRFGNNNKKPLDERGIDKNIKNIMTTEIQEKENQRDYSSKVIDKQKANSKYDEKVAKKANKSRRNNQFDEFDSDKLKGLKQVDKLSNMFSEQDGGMLEYYDLSTARGKKNKKKVQKNEEERNKQKIFELKEITIPDNITVKDLAQEMKKTTAEVIKKLFTLGIMATINNVLDFDTAYLVASEFGITANKKEIVKQSLFFV